MKLLWDHISECQTAFSGYMDDSWENTKVDEIRPAVDKLLKKLKEMKVEKRCNAYTGILDEIKTWLIFLPLIEELGDPGMRERHWNQIRKLVGKDFTVDANLKLKDVYELELTKYAEDVEEITD